MRVLRPPRVKSGDRVAVVAPSGPVPREAFLAGMRELGDRYRLDWGEPLFSQRGFLAGTDERRSDELRAALADKSVRAILCARGGYGLARVLETLPRSALLVDPKPIVGFSDVTALHAAAFRAGMSSVHGPNITQIGSLEDPFAAVCDLVERLESPSPPPPWGGLRTVCPGPIAVGPAVGGNLEVLSRLLGTAWAPPFDGAVLFIEEVTERPYRLDRELTHLRLAGVLDKVAAVVVGELLKCDEADGSIRGEEVVAERLAGLRVPVLSGAPFGHGSRNKAFPHGAPVRIDTRSGTVEFLDGAVA